MGGKKQPHKEAGIPTLGLFKARAFKLGKWVLDHALILQGFSVCEPLIISSKRQFTPNGSNELRTGMFMARKMDLLSLHSFFPPKARPLDKRPAMPNPPKKHNNKRRNFSIDQGDHETLNWPVLSTDKRPLLDPLHLRYKTPLSFPYFWPNSLAIHATQNLTTSPILDSALSLCLGAIGHPFGTRRLLAVIRSLLGGECTRVGFSGSSVRTSLGLKGENYKPRRPARYPYR